MKSTTAFTITDVPTAGSKVNVVGRFSDISDKLLLLRPRQQDKHWIDLAPGEATIAQCPHGDLFEVRRHWQDVNND
jgi:hypothetical protein